MSFSLKHIRRYIFLTFLLLLGTGYVYSQNEAVRKAGEKRSLTTLMNVISRYIMNSIDLTDGDYTRGDWNAVKKSRPPKALYWSYPTGVCLLGMQRVYDVTHDQKILDFINRNNRISADQFAYLRWQKQTFGTVYKTYGFEKLWRFSMLDDCGAMGAAILETNLRHNVQFTPNLNDMAEMIGNYVTNIQYRLDDGTFWRPDSPDGLTIWADDLYMGLPFLIRWAEYKRNPSLLDDAANQIISYAAKLQDTDGVWYHAYFVDKKEHSCCKWGRGNGWVTVAEAEVLSVLPQDHPKFKAVLDIYKKHIDGLIKLQSADGLWNQVLDHPELTWGTETSCSAQFTYAIARGINRGWLDRSKYTPVVKKALAALSDTSRISIDGKLLKVGASTSIGKDINYYNERPVEDEKEYSHGSGLMLFALSEMNTLLRNEETASLASDGITRKPYLQIATPGSIVVRWQTETGVEGILKYGTAINSLTETIKEPEERIYHEIKATGLTPGTKYYYSVNGSSAGSEEEYFITPADRTKESGTRIWVISDFGQTDSRDNARRIQTVDLWKSFNNGSYHADFVLSLGDQSEDDGVFQLQHNYFSILENVLESTPLYTGIGNHDNHDNVINYLKTFTLPASGEMGGIPSGTEKYYSFNYSNIHVVMLCSEVNKEEMKAETEWLRKDLEKNKQEWLIAGMHQPLQSAGYHPTDNDEWAQQRRNEWLTLLEDHGVDLILQGHNHVYERSFLVDNLIGNSTEVKDANILNRNLGRDDEGGVYKKPAGNQSHKGTVFITCTGGGVANAIKHYPVPYSFIPVKFPGADYEGSLVIDVKKNQMDVKFICDELNEKGSHIWDYFTIKKGN